MPCTHFLKDWSQIHLVGKAGWFCLPFVQITTTELGLLKMEEQGFSVEANKNSAQ